MILVISSKMRYYNSCELINSEIKKATIILNNKKSNFYYIKTQQADTTASLEPLPCGWHSCWAPEREGVSQPGEDSDRGDRWLKGEASGNTRAAMAKEGIGLTENSPRGKAEESVPEVTKAEKSRSSWEDLLKIRQNQQQVQNNGGTGIRPLLVHGQVGMQWCKCRRGTMSLRCPHTDHVWPRYRWVPWKMSVNVDKCGFWEGVEWILVDTCYFLQDRDEVIGWEQPERSASQGSTNGSNQEGAQSCNCWARGPWGPCFTREKRPQGEARTPPPERSLY